MNRFCECGCGGEVRLEKHRFIYKHCWIGRKISNNHKIKLSSAAIGKHFSNEHKLNLSISHTGKKQTKETVDKRIKLIVGKKRSEESKQKISSALMGNKNSLGRPISKEHRLKISQTHKGKKLSEEQKRIFNRKGWKHRPETKKQMSVSAIKRISIQSFNGGPMFPREGLNERPILNQLENNSNIKFIRNNYKVLDLGKFIDGYIEKYNLSVEVLESHHYKSDGSLSDYDQDREVTFAFELGCMTYFINEQEFLKNPEKEIQRFKDFLKLLDEGVN